MFKSKYIIKSDFSDCWMTIENSTIKISGFIKIKFNEQRYSGISRKTLEKMTSFVYADFFSIIVDNFKSPDEIKRLLIQHLKGKETQGYKIVKFRIDDVYNVQKRERKLKLDKIKNLK